MARSTKKGPFVDEHLIKKVEVLNAANDKKVIKTWSRRSTISSPSSSATPSPYTTAKSSFLVYVTENMVGHKFMNFLPTRTFKGHTQKSAESSAKPRRAKPWIRGQMHPGVRAKGKVMAVETQEYRAEARFQRVSPQKARLVLNLVKGRGVQDALETLAFTKKRIAPVIHKVLTSALDNAKYLSDDRGLDLDVDNLYVKTAVANEGPRMKRIRPAPMGRAFRYQRRLTHIIVSVAERPGSEGLVTRVDADEAKAIKPAKKAAAKKTVAKKAVVKKASTAKVKAKAKA